VQHELHWPAMAISIIGAAATLGTFRFGILPQIRPVHSLFSAMGASVSFPLLGLATWYGPVNDSSILERYLPPFFLLLGFYVRTRSKMMLYDIALAAIGVIGMLVHGFINSNWSAVYGASAVLIATLVGSRGYLINGWLKKVDFFHYMLAGGVVFLSKSFLES